MRRIARALVAVACSALALALPGSASADSFTDELSCSSDSGDEICSGVVPSFDGAALDVDLTKPSGGGDGKHPLIVMLHGFGNDKHEWESKTDDGDGADKSRWNSHWFARHGYYVLTYTARGFRTDSESRPDQPNTPDGTSVSEPNGHLMLKSREFEVRDTRGLPHSSARASISTRTRLR